MIETVRGFVIVSPKGKIVPSSLASQKSWAWQNAAQGIRSPYIPDRQDMERKGYRAVQVTVNVNVEHEEDNGTI